MKNCICHEEKSDCKPHNLQGGGAATSIGKFVIPEGLSATGKNGGSSIYNPEHDKPHPFNRCCMKAIGDMMPKKGDRIILNCTCHRIHDLDDAYDRCWQHDGENINYFRKQAVQDCIKYMEEEIGRYKNIHQFNEGYEYAMDQIKHYLSKMQ